MQPTFQVFFVEVPVNTHLFLNYHAEFRLRGSNTYIRKS